MSLDGGFWAWLNALNFGTLGYLVVGLFITTWLVSVGVWKVRKVEERWGSAFDN